ncbi:MAG: hypothetical protein ACK53L_30105, partial [Pirellulaceae bacterium]
VSACLAADGLFYSERAGCIIFLPDAMRTEESTMSPADPPSTSVDTLAAAKASTSGHLASDSPPPSQPHPPATAGSTPGGWRLAILSGIVLLAGIAYDLRETIGLRGQAAVGVVFFFGLVAA